MHLFLLAQLVESSVLPWCSMVAVPCSGPLLTPRHSHHTRYAPSAPRLRVITAQAAGSVLRCIAKPLNQPATPVKYLLPLLLVAEPSVHCPHAQAIPLTMHGVDPITLSWFFSPILTGCASVLNFPQPVTQLTACLCFCALSVLSVQGVVPIIMSWFFSPILTGAASALIFFLVRTCVMRRQNARNLVFWVLPVAVFITLFINVFFVL